MVFEGGDLAERLARWGEIIENAPRELESFLYSATQRGAPSFVQLINIYAGDDDRAAVDALTPLLDIGRCSTRKPSARRTPRSCPRPKGHTRVAGHAPSWAAGWRSTSTPR